MLDNALLISHNVLQTTSYYIFYHNKSTVIAGRTRTRGLLAQSMCPFFGTENI